MNVKINNIEYPAKIEEAAMDYQWDGRESKSITVSLDYPTVSNLFFG